MKELFERTAEPGFRMRPLAYRMRPDTLEEFYGQTHLLEPGNRLRAMIDSGRVFSIILAGPPGSGKTALAGIIASRLDARIIRLNAVNASVSDIRKAAAEGRREMSRGVRTLLIVDEFHRFSRNQQESLLPDVEEGNLILIGLTTENPFYFISGPLLSRASVFKFKPLENKDISKILNKALEDKDRGLGNSGVKVAPEALSLIASAGEGDARYALNMLELCVTSAEKGERIDVKTAERYIGRKKIRYDRKGDEHYDSISAFIKSMRGSDPDAAVFYLARILSAGDDPRFIARRIAICASEDVGNADPRALILANAAMDAVERIGMPEARITLAQAAIYIACAPKSNASYMAIERAERYLKEHGSGAVPEHLTSAGSGKYLYPHDHRYGYVRQKYMEPDEEFFTPSGRGHEKLMAKFLRFLKEKG